MRVVLRVSFLTAVLSVGVAGAALIASSHGVASGPGVAASQAVGPSSVNTAVNSPETAEQIALGHHASDDPPFKWTAQEMSDAKAMPDDTE